MLPIEIVASSSSEEISMVAESKASSRLIGAIGAGAGVVSAAMARMGEGGVSAVLVGGAGGMRLGEVLRGSCW